MDFWREELAALKARQQVQDLALQALVQSHPDPRGLLEAWQTLRASAVTEAYSIPGHRNSAWLGEHFQSYANDWTLQLQQASGLQPPIDD